MNHKFELTTDNQQIDQAVSGDKAALEALLAGVQDMVFNLSLRMLGTVPDAEDAAQEIFIRIMTNLSSFRKESSFETWVYRLTTNYLINYQKSMFAQRPLNFEFYGNDIRYAQTKDIDQVVDDVTRETMAEELKMSCTNVMLQCLEAENRCIFILGTMFHADSRIAADILNITPENYRQKLSRTRKKMAGFLAQYCGLTDTGFCRCQERVDYAIAQKRINPQKTEFRQLAQIEKSILNDCKAEMEKFDSSILGHDPHDLTFKLVRDTRFSHDKSPYNPAFRCHISSAGKLPVPVGYFLLISPGGRSFFGGGLFTDMFKDATNRIRRHICTHPKEFRRILTAPDFTQNFQLSGTALKNIPKDYPPDSEAGEYLKYKSWYIEDTFSDSILDDSQYFIQYAAERFRLMKDFNDFLNQALEGFTMPQR